MVEFRKVSKKLYVLAAVITLFLFIFGVLLGMLIDNERLRWLEQTSKQQELELKSLQFQYFYLTSFEGQESCPVLQSALKRTVSDLSGSLDRFQDYKDSSGDSAEYQEVGRRYLLDNLNYWLIAQKAKRACGLDVANILYFYHDECGICSNQGVVLTYFKNVFGEKLLVFPIDVSLKGSESAVDTMLARFNVTRYPTVVVGDEKYEGVVGPEEMKNIICGEFDNETACE